MSFLKSLFVKCFIIAQEQNCNCCEREKQDVTLPTEKPPSSPPVKKMEYTQKLDFFHIYYRSENLRIRIDTNLFLLLMSKDKK